LILSFNFKRLSERQSKLKNYLKRYWGISPNDYSLYEKALRHKSVVGAGKFCHRDCNERLELLGDAVLDTVVTEYLFYKFPDANEGVLTKIRARIVNRQTLGEVGMNANLDQMIEARIGSDDSKEKIVGNALEAWLGAIYLDKGFEASKKTVKNYLLKNYLDIEHVVHNSIDFKSQLIEWAQQQKVVFEFNTYACLEETEGFVCEVLINGTLKSKTKERSKKKAEKEAAKLAFHELGLQHVQA
jgi:ribonuclease-3